MKKVLLLSLTLVAVLFTACNQSAKNKELVKKDVFGTKDGKEVRSRNLDKIWEYVGNKDRYENYVRDEVAAFLKEA